MLQVENISGGYHGETIVHDLNFTVEKGEFFGILGPNGSGKTTLLKMISGLISVKTGTISLEDKPLSHFSAKQLAKKVAVLPQMQSASFEYTVKETVSLGRYPFQKGLFKQWTEKDEKVVTEAMAITEIEAYANHRLSELSGGEKQRVFLAQALAQEPVLLLLDEPTNHLDISHQKQLLDHLKEWSIQKGLTVISIFHDLNLASLYCDRLLLMKDGRQMALDDPNHVVEEKLIERVYETSVKKRPHPELPKPQVMIAHPFQEENKTVFRSSDIAVSNEIISLQLPKPLKTLSSGVIGAGFGWYRSFVNRHVPKNYKCDDVKSEMEMYLQKHHFHPKETVGMMTAANLTDVAIDEWSDGEIKVVVVVTAGVSNAVNVAECEKHVFESYAGTINTWVLIEGNLSDEAFIQAVMTATEAKAKAMADEKIKDTVTNTIATGTSTDSILIAATQQGETIDYAGTITKAGKLIGKGVYECTVRALLAYKRRMIP
ncbi:adenosylcobinamide amidohydrolase [Bacillus kexueae]|uniref:adenosylcobinamide amidohydrolase n=1 Tax=Aeribacillus kexueae TaxID=2078952 RepID=UPI001FAEF007|nr:adenosylcobinamide amidohydrolase [Bacillus kexueae]